MVECLFVPVTLSNEFVRVIENTVHLQLVARHQYKVLGREAIF